MNWQEKQLRSWQPRRPAAGFKRRIFSTAPVAAAPPLPAWSLGWLAPATACLLLALLALKSENDFANGPIIGPATFALALSNQNYAAYAANGSQYAQNRPATVTFDWTNRGNSASCIPFAPVTNASN
jgi:hypothetical protein